MKAAKRCGQRCPSVSVTDESTATCERKEFHSGFCKWAGIEWKVNGDGTFLVSGGIVPTNWQPGVDPLPMRPDGGKVA